MAVLRVIVLKCIKQTD